jgi:ATP-dependent exoDNAse (exonuclease V) beta subunit
VKKISADDVKKSDAPSSEGPSLADAKPLLITDYTQRKLPTHSVLSFSSLEAAHKRFADAQNAPDDDAEKYDESSELDGQDAVSAEANGRICLPRGKKSGIAVHTLLEKLDFARAQDQRQALIESVISDYNLAPRPAWRKRLGISESPASGGSSNEAKDHIRAYLENLVQGLLAVPIPQIDPQFQLSMLTPSVCLKEVKFAERNPVASHHPLEDMMTGVIDLVFWHNEKMYIADWKTNWLPNYGYAAMKGEMEAGKYHLQVAIYADAVSRFLRQRGLPSSCLGGMLYVFVRAFTTGDYRESDAPAEPGQGLYFMDRDTIAKHAERQGVAE